MAKIGAVCCMYGYTPCVAVHPYCLVDPIPSDTCIVFSHTLSLDVDNQPKPFFLPKMQAGGGLMKQVPTW